MTGLGGLGGGLPQFVALLAGLVALTDATNQIILRSYGNVQLHRQDAVSFLKPKSRWKRGLIDDIANGEEHQRRAKERMKEADLRVAMTKELRCFQICWDVWGTWTTCSDKCHSGTRTRSRVVKTGIGCDGIACPGHALETQRCHINCGVGGIVSGNNCACKPGYLGDCCEERITCDKPAKPSRGYLGNIVVWPAFYDAVVTYSCDPGFALIGKEQRRCQLDRTFSGPDPTCQRIICAAPTVPTNGELVNTKPTYQYDDTVGYKCKLGFVLKGAQTRRCVLGEDLTGVWSAFDPQCIVKDCGDPGTPRHGSRIGQQFTYGYKVSFTCERGFTMIGSEERTCLETASWDGSQPVCKEILCEMMERPIHGTISSKDSTVDASIEFACEHGYNLTGSSILQCLSNGTWDGTAPVCEAINCGDPGSPDHGSREDNGFHLDQVVKFTCHDGYILQGFMHTKCLSDGSWSNPLPICQSCPKDYYKEGDPNGGQCLRCPHFSHTVTAASTSQEQCICNHGYRGPPSGPCIEVSCRNLPAPDHGFIVSCDNKMNDPCEFDCEDGYILSQGTSLRTCTENGVWDGSHPECEACRKDTYKADVGSCLPCPDNSHTQNKASMRHHCVCDDGYQITDEQTCEDIDECSDNDGLGDCEQACENFIGGYNCVCTIPGYLPDENNPTDCIPHKQCRNLTEDDAPENGGLACHWYTEENSQQCTMKCNPGFELPMRTNAYETCGPVTGYKWSYQQVNPKEELFPCILEFFPEFRFEGDSAYFVNNCSDLTEEEKEDVRREFAETLTNEGICWKAQDQLCDMRNIDIICGRTRRRRGTDIEEVDVANMQFNVFAKNSSQEIIHLDQEVICRKLRIPRLYCPRYYVAAYKRYVKAGILYAKRQVEDLYNNKRNSAVFQAASRTFEPVEDGTHVTEVEVICPLGMTSSDNGVCLPCQAGSMYNRDSKTCDNCPVGYYQPESLKEECILCPLAKTSSEGAAVCDQDCPAGFHGDGCLQKCACVNGNCDPRTAVCTCHPGWEGTACDIDIPGCRDGYCFQEVTCIDIPAPGSGFRCGPCPPGYSGNGAQCMTP